MGFFSSLFGGGGSSSSSSSQTSNVTVNPTTNLDIEFDFDELAQALKDGNAGELLTESAKIQLLAREQEINAQQIAIESKNLALTENGIKSLQSFIPLIVVSAIYLVFIKKKGVKK